MPSFVFTVNIKRLIIPENYFVNLILHDSWRINHESESRNLDSALLLYSVVDELEKRINVKV